jgi:hypothetical protein
MVAYTIIHGHDIRTSFLKVLKFYTAYTDILEWPECYSVNATVGLIVCTVYKGGQPYKPCVQCKLVPHKTHGVYGWAPM